MSKRQKFVITTLILLSELILSRFEVGAFLQWRFRAIIFAASSLFLSLWAVHDEDFNGHEWLILPILPTFFAIGSLLVFPLLPDVLGGGGESGLLFALMIKIAYLLFFIIGFYASLLTTNIFNVSAVKTIQLLRVAHSIGFLISVGTCFLFYMVITSFHLSHALNFLLVSAVTFPLALQAIWSVNLEEKISRATKNYSFLTAIILGEISWVLSFWPISGSIFAIFLTAIFYELVGIIQYHLGEKLSSKIANEFIIVAIVVFLLTVVTTQWGS